MQSEARSYEVNQCQRNLSMLNFWERRDHLCLGPPGVKLDPISMVQFLCQCPSFVTVFHSCSSIEKVWTNLPSRSVGTFVDHVWVAWPPNRSHPQTIFVGKLLTSMTCLGRTHDASDCSAKFEGNEISIPDRNWVSYCSRRYVCTRVWFLAWWLLFEKWRGFLE